MRLAGGRVGRGAVVMHAVQLRAALGRAAVYALPPSVAGAARCHTGRAEEQGEGRGVGVGTGADGSGAGGRGRGCRVPLAARDCDLLGERQRGGCDRLQAAVAVAGARSRARGCISLAAVCVTVGSKGGGWRERGGVRGREGGAVGRVGRAGGWGRGGSLARGDGTVCVCVCGGGGGGAGLAPRSLSRIGSTSGPSLLPQPCSYRGHRTARRRRRHPTVAKARPRRRRRPQHCL